MVSSSFLVAFKTNLASLAILFNNQLGLVIMLEKLITHFRIMPDSLCMFVGKMKGGVHILPQREVHIFLDLNE